MAQRSNLTDPRIVRPDSRGRISLGRYATGVSSFLLEELEDGALRLIPRVENPAREAWLDKNPQALESITRGLEDSKAGRTRSRGSFASYAEDDDE